MSKNVGKEWTGNNKSIYTRLGASNHAIGNREVNDYYATDPIAIDLLLKEETFNKNIWECACGEGHMSERLKENGFEVYSTDLVDRGYQDEILDFLNSYVSFDGDIITNPPYKYAQEFIEKSIDNVNEGNKVAMFLKLTFLESKKRKELFEKYPFKTLYVASGRISCAKNGDFEEYPSSAVAYGWYVWEKGFKGDPTIKWIN